ncbi:MAG TPA: hypothetical protein VF766_07950, partial [Pyrinomonadaceae bacterium]
MKKGLLRAVALSGAVFHALPSVILTARTNRFSGRAGIFLLAALALISSAGISTKAQSGVQTPLRRLAPLRLSEIPTGSRVTITSDTSLDDYTAYRSGDRFHVLIPQAAFSSAVNSIERGRGFTAVRVERRESEVELSFSLQPGATASVSQKFNRLDVIFNAPADAATLIAGMATQAAVSEANTRASNPVNQSAPLPIAEKVSFAPTPEPTPATTAAPKEETNEAAKSAST